MKILRKNINNNIPINIDNNFNIDLLWEENMTNYEQEMLKVIINPSLNFETSKYAHETYLSSNGSTQDDIWFYFYFYSDSGTTHNGGLNYEYVGLSLQENSKLTVNTNESFFRLDFYKIPTLEDLSLDYFNKKLVFTKNLRIPLGEKIYFKPINDYVYVPVFHGSSIINEENMNFYWFDDDNVLSDQTLTGNTFYMTAKYFNSIDGSIYNFTKNDLDINDIPKESGDTYYKVTINKTNKTYNITGSGRFGISTNPVKFYSNSLPNLQYAKYTGSTESPDYTVYTGFTVNITDIIKETICPSNDGVITGSLSGTIIYPYEIWVNNILFSEYNNTPTFNITGLTAGQKNILVADNIGFEKEVNNINITKYDTLTYATLTFDYTVVNSTSTNYLAPNGSLTIQNLVNGNGNDKYSAYISYLTVYDGNYYYLNGETKLFTGNTVTFNDLGYSSYDGYDINVEEQGCSINKKIYTNVVIQSVPYVIIGEVEQTSKISSYVENNEIKFTGGSNITEKGIYCSKVNSVPTSNDSNITVNIIDGLDIKFNASILNLKPGTTYYVRPYSVNNIGKSYGEVKSFTTTSDIPYLFTTEPYDITINSVTSGGYDIIDNGEQITEKGLIVTTGGVNNKRIGVTSFDIQDISSEVNNYIITGDTYWHHELFNINEFDPVANNIPAWLNINLTMPNYNHFQFHRTGSTTDEIFNFINEWNFIIEASIDPDRVDNDYDRWYSPKAEATLTLRNDYYSDYVPYNDDIVFYLNQEDLRLYIPSGLIYGYYTKGESTIPFRYQLDKHITNKAFKGIYDWFYFMEVKCDNMFEVMASDVDYIGLTGVLISRGIWDDWLSNIVDITQTIAPITIVNPTSGTDDFILNVTGLTQNTDYNIMSYAINSIGTGYGDIQTFKTLE